MVDASEFDQMPRADTVSVEIDHDQWALHDFAFEQDEGWLPMKFRRYHRDRRMNGELMEGYYDEFIPVAYDADHGQILKKNAEYKTQYCPECEVEARKIEGETVCPECGLICHEAGPSHEIIRDGKAAGRTEGYESGS